MLIKTRRPKDLQQRRNFFTDNIPGIKSVDGLFLHAARLQPVFLILLVFRHPNLPGSQFWGLVSGSSS